MVKILSFDVGIINLAYCIFDSERCKICHWGIIDLKVQGFSGKVPSGNKSIAKAANDIHITLIKELDALPILLDVDYVVIEKQPSFNPKMRIIGGCLQSYFYIRGIVDKQIVDKQIVDKQIITSIEFFSPKHKLKCYTGPELKLVSKTKSKYAQTKKLGIMICSIKLDEYSETEFKKVFDASKKKDDLADCYLQAITFCIFKKFISISKGLNILVEEKNLLTKLQIKKQLKEYLDSKIKVYSVNELKVFAPIEKNLIETLNNMDSHLKESIKSKFKIENLESIFDKLSMKSYKYYHYL